ncbi:uncharacterized protein PHACADRAFT_248257 [Phanerochaete carnosa HHB-10118-sp]|uniref:Uncharacterized protein n=1 Tax=Phanerochaete carnosa (strain HHB-10118-sp) TaxID=650164 RepID=K5XER0_PHACS|nr:uncharacterized protein PHACADRAFT_248257 [Phanerochaete carnosa HHB-10118-sp]EKM61572.1 hypothetical protein PHACADRAFT_248257 [Phanerochaete carnosa HHB-10118-sp]
MTPRQDHAFAWRGACPISSTSVDPPRKTLRPSTSANDTPQARRTLPRRAEKAPQAPQNQNAKGVARPLKTPTRTR